MHASTVHQLRKVSIDDEKVQTTCDESLVGHHSSTAWPVLGVAVESVEKCVEGVDTHMTRHVTSSTRGEESHTATHTQVSGMETYCSYLSHFGGEVSDDGRTRGRRKGDAKCGIRGEEKYETRKRK